MLIPLLQSSFSGAGVDSSLYYYRHMFWRNVPDPVPTVPCGELIDWTLEGSRQANIENEIECMRKLLKKIEEKKKS
jgi:hypothetical protein